MWHELTVETIVNSFYIRRNYLTIVQRPKTIILSYRFPMLLHKVPSLLLTLGLFFK